MAQGVHAGADLACRGGGSGGRFGIEAVGCVLRGCWHVVRYLRSGYSRRLEGGVVKMLILLGRWLVNRERGIWENQEFGPRMHKNAHESATCRQTVKVASGCCNFRAKRAPCFNRQSRKNWATSWKKELAGRSFGSMIEIVFACSNGN